ncbi:hypothetical protein QZM01_14695 [Burkholderia multivorans]|nr:hypothetical protein [Burkholderia multivorans]
MAKFNKGDRVRVIRKEQGVLSDRAHKFLLSKNVHVVEEDTGGVRLVGFNFGFNHDRFELVIQQFRQFDVVRCIDAGKRSFGDYSTFLTEGKEYAVLGVSDGCLYITGDHGGPIAPHADRFMLVRPAQDKAVAPSSDETVSTNYEVRSQRLGLPLTVRKSMAEAEEFIRLYAGIGASPAEFVITKVETVKRTTQVRRVKRVCETVYKLEDVQ